MDDKTQLALLKAQARAMDLIFDVMTKPRPLSHNEPTKVMRIVFCDAPDQAGCSTCEDRIACREWMGKPKEA